MKRIGFLILTILFPFLTFAQDAAPTKNVITNDDLMMAIVVFIAGFTLLLLFILILLLYKLREHLLDLTPLNEEELEYGKPDFWSRVLQLRPLAMEKKLILDHEYDGIQELDNPTPPWFMFLFYSSIIIAIFYGIYYHAIGDGKVMENEYNAEVKEAEISREAYLKKFANAVNESNVTVVTDKTMLADGKTIYDNNCVACHGALGEGKVGPNLTDAFWIHGGKIGNIFKTISEGVPEKGMISWKKQLNPVQIQHVCSYILTMAGTNPPNPKEAQGVEEPK